MYIYGCGLHTYLARTTTAICKSITTQQNKKKEGKRAAKRIIIDQFTSLQCQQWQQQWRQQEKYI